MELRCYDLGFLVGTAVGVGGTAYSIPKGCIPTSDVTSGKHRGPLWQANYAGHSPNRMLQGVSKFCR